MNSSLSPFSKWNGIYESLSWEIFRQQTSHNFSHFGQLSSLFQKLTNQFRSRHESINCGVWWNRFALDYECASSLLWIPNFLLLYGWRITTNDIHVIFRKWLENCLKNLWKEDVIILCHRPEIRTKRSRGRNKKTHQTIVIKWQKSSKNFHFYNFTSNSENDWEICSSSNALQKVVIFSFSLKSRP